MLRVARVAVVGAAVLLALHLFMLIGHGHAGHGSMPSPGAMPSATSVDEHMRSTAGLDARPSAGVDMAATCFTVLASLLLLGVGARRGIRTPAFMASAAMSGRAAGRRVRPRARSPVELCVFRS